MRVHRRRRLSCLVFPTCLHLKLVSGLPLTFSVLPGCPLYSLTWLKAEPLTLSYTETPGQGQAGSLAPGDTLYDWQDWQVDLVFHISAWWLLECSAPTLWIPLAKCNSRQGQLESSECNCTRIVPLKVHYISKFTLPMFSKTNVSSLSLKFPEMEKVHPIILLPGQQPGNMVWCHKGYCYLAL